MPRNAPLLARATAFIASLILGCGQELAEPEIHLIPEGYMGDVFIIHGDPKGAPPEREGSSRVYRVPAGGILRSQTPMNYGWGKPRYFYVTPSGKRRKIEGYWPSTIHDTPENRSDRSFGIFFPRSGEMSSAENPCAVIYEQYYVGTKPHLLTRQDGVDEERFLALVKQEQVCSSGV